MTKYELYIDRKAGTNGKAEIEYIELEGKTILEAMAEADKIWEADGNIYLARIMERFGKTERESVADSTWKYSYFKAVLARRSFGWHINDSEHGENEHIAKMTETPFDKWMAIA